MRKSGFTLLLSLLLLTACADSRSILVDKDYKAKQASKAGKVNPYQVDNVAGDPQSAPVPAVKVVEVLKPSGAQPQKCKFLEKGLASWYGHELAGNHTANGELFNPDGISAAHPTLPFGTIVYVTLDSGKGNPLGVSVRINDRGPFVKGRIIDLSWGAAKKLGMMDTQKVHIYRCP